MLGSEANGMGFGTERAGAEMSAATDSTAVITATTESRLERRKARTRSAILEAAGALFHEQGYDETSIQQVAARADTGVGTLYGYFRSKDELLREVLRERSLQAVERYYAKLAGRTSAIDRVVGALEVFAEFVRENRAIVRAQFHVQARHRDPSDEPPTAWLRRAFEEILREGIEAGELRPVPVETTSRMIVATQLLANLGIGSFRGLEQDQQVAEDLRTIARLLLEK